MPKCDGVEGEFKMANAVAGQSTAKLKTGLRASIDQSHPAVSPRFSEEEKRFENANSSQRVTGFQARQ